MIIDTKLQSYVIIPKDGKIVQKRSSHIGNLGR